jgi:hypothetical protein
MVSRFMEFQPLPFDFDDVIPLQLCLCDRPRQLHNTMGSGEDGETDTTDRNVAYIWSKEYEEVSDCLPSNIGRVPFYFERADLVFTNPLPHPRLWSRQIHDVHSSTNFLTLVS